MSFNINVKSESQSVPKGSYQADLDDDGLSLTRKKAEPIEIAVGTPARYRGKNRFEVKLEDGIIECAVSKLGVYQHRLARDLAAFLGRKRPAPALGEYSLPWYLWVTSALPLGIPVIALGGAVPALIGFGFASLCYGVAQKEDWPEWARMVVSLAISGLAYVLFFVALIAVAAAGVVKP